MFNPTNTPRNIKQLAGGWLWQEKAALRTIAEHYAGSKLLAARSVYLALTEIASDQHTPTQARAAAAYIGQRAGISEGTARRYLHELAALGLLAIDIQERAWNTYHLLAIDVPVADDLAAATMVLADGKGISAPLDVAEGITGTSLEVVRGSAGGPQYNKVILKTKDNKQTTVVVPVGIASSSTTNISGELETLADEHEGYVAATYPSSDDERAEAVKELAATGVRYTVAQEVVALYGAVIVLAWIGYARAHRDSVKQPAGFILKMVRSGEQVPAAARPAVTASRLDASKYTQPGGRYYHLFNRDVEYQPPTQNPA